MKKILCVLLAVILIAVSIPAFAEQSITEILVSDRWEYIDALGSIRFNSDGTGDIDNMLSITWELAGSDIEITIVDYATTEIFTYTDNNGIPELLDIDSNLVLRRSKDISSVAEDTVELVFEDGTTQQTTGKEICENYYSNPIAAQNYLGATITIIGTVERIYGPTNYNGHLMDSGYLELKGPWVVEIPYGCEALAATLKVGDTVKVPGIISSIIKMLPFYSEMDQIIVYEKFDEESQTILPMELYIPENAE